MQCIILVINDLDPEAVSVPKDNSHLASNDDVATSFVTLGNDASNLPSPNDSEETLSPEFQVTLLQIQVSHSLLVSHTHTINILQHIT